MQLLSFWEYIENLEYHSSTDTPDSELYFIMPSPYHSLIYLFLVTFNLRRLGLIENWMKCSFLAYKCTKIFQNRHKKEKILKKDANSL